MSDCKKKLRKSDIKRGAVAGYQSQGSVGDRPDTGEAHDCPMLIMSLNMTSLGKEGAIVTAFKTSIGVI